MTRPLVFIATFLAIFTALLSALAWIEALGVVSHSRLALWGQAIAFSEGEGAFKTFVTTYPPLPLWLSAGAQMVLSEETASSPSLAAAAFGALLGAMLFGRLTRAGFGLAGAGLATALILFNPIALLAMAEGPGGALLLGGACGLGAGLFALRRDADPPSVMGASFSLGLMAFSHPLGLAAAATAVPFALACAPPGMLARSVSGLTLAIFFPVGFGVLSFGYVNWINGEPAWSFLAAATGEETSWRRVGALALCAAPAGACLLGLAVAARRRSPISDPSLILWGLGASVPLLAAAFGMNGGATIALTPLLGFTAAALLRWPAGRGRAVLIAGLLMIGAAGGALATFLDPAPASRALAALTRPPQEGSASAHAALGAFLRDYDDVLIDAATFPAVVAGRGSARGLVTPVDPRFGLTLLSRRLSTRLVAVRSPESDDGDKIRRAFPRLFMRGEPGFRLIYDSEGWRVYERDSALTAQKDTP